MLIPPKITMPKKEEQYPYCYGKIENVFPVSDDGLRASPAHCGPCLYKTQCLRSAMQTPHGTKVKQEALNRAHRSGMIGFWERWSKKKLLEQKKGSKK
jgi:hypothetical protein